MIEKKIIRYVELFFIDIPYSKATYFAKEQIIKRLNQIYQLEVQRESKGAFERVVKKYPTLLSLAVLADFSKEDVTKWEAKETVWKKKEIQSAFKKERKRIVLFLLLAIFTGATFYNLLVTRTFLYGLFLSVLVPFTIWFFKRMNHKQTKIEFCSLDGYEYLKTLYDLYTKKLFNSIFIGIPLLAFLTISLIELGLNSKLSEMIEFGNVMLFYLEIAIFMVGKNGMITKWIHTILQDQKTQKTKAHWKRGTTLAVGYWILVFGLILFLQNTFYIHIFLIACCIYFLLVLVYTMTLRKEIVYKNLLINKKKVILYVCFIALFSLYQFMQRDFWLTQPYINSVPALYTKNHLIQYDDKTGIYTITKEDKGDFRLLQLTDIHLGGSVYSYPKDMKALKAVYDLISYSKPDFVIVTGDLTFPMGIMSFSFNNSAPVMQFASFMRNLGVPWAFTYGNHDTESLAKYSEDDLNTLYQSLAYKTSKTLLYPYIQPTITGRNNQVIELRNQDGRLNQALFLIDSNAYTGEGINKYDYIHEDQVSWYKEQVLRLQKEEGRTISSMAFFHIPLQEYRIAYELYAQGKKEVTYYFGANEEQLFNKVCASEYPSTLFDVAKQLGSTKAFFCGHDHYNNMSLEYQGIRLTYGMSIDYLAMPGIENETKQRGGTLITIHEDTSYDINQIPLMSIQH